jgi:hypothetical protein
MFPFLLTAQERIPWTELLVRQQLGIPAARSIRRFRPRVPSPQKSPRVLLIKPAEVLLFYTGADNEDGMLTAIEECKLTRVPSEGGVPRAASRFCLDRAKSGWGDVDGVALASQPLRAWSRQAWFRAKGMWRAPIKVWIARRKPWGDSDASSTTSESNGPETSIPQRPPQRQRFRKLVAEKSCSRSKID